VSLETTQAASLDITSAGLSLRTDGEPQRLRLSGKLPPQPSVVVDGQPQPVTLTGTDLLIPVSAGTHVIQIK
jgi:hypothetical protein